MRLLVARVVTTANGWQSKPRGISSVATNVLMIWLMMVSQIGRRNGKILGRFMMMNQITFKRVLVALYLAYSVATDSIIWGGAVYYFFFN